MGSTGYHYAQSPHDHGLANVKKKTEIPHEA